MSYSQEGQASETEQCAQVTKADSGENFGIQVCKSSNNQAPLCAAILLLTNEIRLAKNEGAAQWYSIHISPVFIPTRRVRPGGWDL